MNEVVVTCVDAIDDKAKAAVWAGLKAYNDRYAVRNQADFTVMATVNDDIIGVAMGESKYDWLILQYVWVREEQRRTGVGSRLLEEIEHIAAQRKCLGVHLDTFEFQAKDFYQKNGYVVFGEIDDHPSGYKRYFMKKTFSLSPVQIDDV